MKNGTQEKKPNPILWFIFAVIIPLILIISIILVVLSFTGFNALDWAKEKEIPVVSSMIPSKEEESKAEQLQRATSKVKNQQEEIDELLMEVSSLEAIIEQLEQDIVKLENKNQSEEASLEGTEDEKQDIDTIKTMAASFKKMKSKQAALIFQDLDNDIAVEILDRLSNDVRGGILEAMDAKEAAKLTELYINQFE